MRSRVPDTDRERALPPSGKTDEDKPADADGQRGEMKRTETLLQETDARQHERNYAGTDKHGETHSAGQKKHFRGTARNQIRTEHDGYAHNGCNQRTEQLNKPGIDAFFRSVSHDKPSQTPAGTDDNQSGNSESGCLKKRNGSD